MKAIVVDDEPALAPRQAGPDEATSFDELYRREQPLVSLGYHHAEIIRWRNGPWNTDLHFTEEAKDQVAGWFAKKGFYGLQEIRDRNLALVKERKAMDEPQ